MTGRVKLEFVILLSFVVVSSAQKPKSWFSFFDRASPTTSTTTATPIRSTQTLSYNVSTSRPLLKPNETGAVFNQSLTKLPTGITPQSVEPSTTRASLTSSRENSYITTPVTIATTKGVLQPAPRSSNKTNTPIPANVPTGRKAAQFPDITFPDHETESGLHVSSNQPRNSEPVQIPVTLLEQLDQVGNIDDFMRLVDNAPSGFATQPETEEDWAQVDGRFGWTETERNTDVINPKAAGCTPENQTVVLSSTDNPLTMYYPMCTRVERCGGCCTSRLLTCEPTKTETLLLRVVRTEYTGGTRLSKPVKEIIPVERHLACKCQCRVKELFQIYDASSCTCKCTNLDDKLKCEADNRTRIWDSKDCVCRCREKGQCSTGYYFDDNVCQCESLATGRHGADTRVQLGNRARAPVSTMRFEDSNLSFKKDEDDDSEDKPDKPVEKVELKKPLWTWH